MNLRDTWSTGNIDGGVDMIQYECSKEYANFDKDTTLPNKYHAKCMLC